MPFVSINPATEEIIAEFPMHSPEQIEAALTLSAIAFKQWRQTTFEERARLMICAAELLEGEVLQVAQLLTSEMGKTFVSAKGEIAKCAETIRYYAEQAESMLADEVISTSASRSGIRYEPLGAVFAVMPWNYALWQVIRFAAPTLMAGNVSVLKHASNVPGVASFLEDLFLRAGLPNGCFVNLFLGARVRIGFRLGRESCANVKTVVV